MNSKTDKIKFLLLIVFTFISTVSFCQSFKIYGIITSLEDSKPLYKAKILLSNNNITTSTDGEGYFEVKNLSPGDYKISVFYDGKQSLSTTAKIVDEDVQLILALEDFNQRLGEITVVGEQYSGTGIRRLRAVEGTAIYSAKKNEVIVLKDVAGNIAANTSRHIFSKVAGLNIWESDGGGLQLGIGARGLNPSRTTDFNTRQNGYDISADAIGYNESYYTPPAEALERIEVIRGAASLQYGPHFGGMVNFIFKKGAMDKPIQVESRQTGGSFGFFNSYNAVGGTVGKVNYYTFYQFKRGDGWRPNSNFDSHNGYLSLNYNVSSRLSIRGEYTVMHYLARQAGGLIQTDLDNGNYRISKRNRNWFRVNWNLTSISLDYKFGDYTLLNIRNFSLFGERAALGFLGSIKSLEDETQNRDLLRDNYLNFGNETRLIHHYNIFDISSTLLTGFRVYKGLTHRQQGEANNTAGADFIYVSPDKIGSDFDFPGINASFFAENIFAISPTLSITPGFRLEYIKTISDGYYLNEKKVKTQEDKSSSRSFPLLGLGISYKPSRFSELYGNISQNYKAINFNDIRVNNPNKIVDPNLKDESGFNADLGARGNFRGKVNYDLTLFHLFYNNRISPVSKTKDNGTVIQYFNEITNVGDSRSIGIESFIEADILGIIRKDTSSSKLFVFSNLTVMQAYYFSGEFKGNNLEYAPFVIFRGGLTFKRRRLSISGQYSYTAKQFSDATNAVLETPNAVSGQIPAYYVIDCFASYNYKFLSFSGGINNLTNHMYYTRRALSYPGPGIIPSDGRNFYISVGIKI